MKRKIALGALTIVLSMSIAANVSAFGLPTFGDLDKPAANGSAETIDSVLAQQESLVKTYQSSLANVLTAQAYLLEAYGLKQKAAELQAEAKAMSSGPVDRKQIEEASLKSNNAAKEIESRINEEAALTDVARKDYQQALLPYATGVVEMVKLQPEFKNFLQSAKDQVSSASLMEKMSVKEKLDVGMYLAMQAPGYTGTVLSTTKKIITYAKKQGVSTKEMEKTLAEMNEL